MNDLARLVALEEIKTLKARYFRGADMRNIDLLREVYHDNVEVDFRGADVDPKTGRNCMPWTDNVVRGAETLLNMVATGKGRVTSVHHGHLPEIEITSDTTATGVWPMMDILRFKDGDPVRELVGYGHYHETYEKVGGKWKIKTIRLTRTFVDVTE